MVLSTLSDMFKATYGEALAKHMRHPVMHVEFYYAPSYSFQSILSLTKLRPKDITDDSYIVDAEMMEMPEGFVKYQPNLGKVAEGIVTVTTGSKVLYSQEFMSQLANSVSFVLKD